MSYWRRVRAAGKMLMPCTPSGGTVSVPPTTPIPPPIVPPVVVLPKNINIVVVNESTVVTDAELLSIVKALQIQVTRDFAPAWGIDCTVWVVPKGVAPNPTFWQLGIFDTSDQAGCFTGDTKISLLNGKEVSFAELVNNYQDEYFWVYSYDVNTKQIVPGKAHSPRLTKRMTKVIKIKLDNGEIITCTPDHKFLTRKGTYKVAATLAVGESLMPLYRRLSSKEEDNVCTMIGYEVVHTGTTAEFWTHKLSDAITNIGHCELCGVLLPDMLHHTRHHKDFNKLNNEPDNIRWLTKEEHLTLHNLVASDNMQKLWQDPVFRARQLARIKAIWQKPEFRKQHSRRMMRYNKSASHRATARLLMNALHADPNFIKRMKPILAANGRMNGAKNFKAYNDSVEGFQHSLGNAEKYLVPYARSKVHREGMCILGPKRLTRYNKSKQGREKSRETVLESHRTGRINARQIALKSHKNGILQPGKYNHVRWHEKRNRFKSTCEWCLATRRNHKVVSVEYSEERRDVYDITVDQYHNFALSSGVFVHNSLGYHDVTNEGLPLAKVFAQTDIQFGSSLSVTMSHELLEMLLDPDINLSVFVQSSETQGIIYAYEAADACEDDQFGYLIDGVLVSDFVLPAYFESFRIKGPFDFQNKITKPFELLAGGYISTYIIPNSGGWTQQSKDAKASKYMNRARLGSRRERRRTPRDQWQKSEVKQ